jgi:hypothetical protein
MYGDGSLLETVSGAVSPKVRQFYILSALVVGWHENSKEKGRKQGPLNIVERPEDLERPRLLPQTSAGDSIWTYPPHTPHF